MSAKEKDPNKLKLDKHIGIKLRNKRVERKLNQTKVADVLGVTFQQVQKYEKATNFPKEYRTMKMVESLGRDYETFKKEYNVYTG